MWALPELLAVITPTLQPPPPPPPLSKGHQTGTYRRGKTDSAQVAAIPAGKKHCWLTRACWEVPAGPGYHSIPLAYSIS